MRRRRLPLATSARAASRRRRRLWPALGAVVIVLVALAVVVVSSSGESNNTISQVLGPPGSVTVLTAPNPHPRATPSPPDHAPFTPAPAAVALAGKLPVQSQVAQLFVVGLDGMSASTLGSVDWGGVVLTRSNFSSDAQFGALAADIATTARTAGTPAPLVAATQEGGPQTAIPDLPPQSEPVIGASGQPAVAEAQARLAATRLRQLNVNMTLAPLADVDTTGGALSGRLFSSNPDEVARFAAAAVRGWASGGVISAVEHFPGSGAASADPDQMTASVGGSLSQLRARDLIPFAAVARSAPVIVISNAAYAAFDGVTPASLLPAAIGLLRHGLGFQGVVMSDDLDATLDPTGETPGTVALSALNAGDDLLYISGPAGERMSAYDAVLSAAEHSSSVRARVHEALLRVLTLKFRYGLLR